MTRRIIARQDPALRARVVHAVPLHYAAGADAALDRPAHVRAGSGITWAGSHVVVVQDDANFFALVDPTSGMAVAVPLPAGVGGLRQFDDMRGNKADKLDLEAVVSVPHAGDGPVVLAFGSGSSARRESVVALRGIGASGAVDGVVVELIPAPLLYARLRAALPFSGSELNVEAAVYLGPAPGGHLRLFNRGNGAPRDGHPPVNATCDVGWLALATHLAGGGASEPPEPCEIVQYDLGVIDGLPITFTDAAVLTGTASAGPHLIVYTAAAEASPDATRDGRVAGSAVGVIAEGPDGSRARWAMLQDESGRPFQGKVEGVALHPDDPLRAHVVIDRDAPGEPAELCEVVLDGPWFSDA